MNTSAKGIIHFLGGRVARNIYLWFVIIYLVLGNDTDHRVYGAHVYILGAFMTSFVIALLTYLNNLVLIPRFLARKRFGLYFISAGASFIFFALVFILVLKTLIHFYPHLLIHQVSLISTPVSTDWSAAAIADEIGMFLFGFALWLFIITMAWFMNDYTRQRKAAEEAQKKQVEAELHFLKNQVNPHFLFNTMNNLYALALKKSDKSPDAILRLSSILRYLLYESNVDKVPFEKEKEIMMAYIDLELLRLPANNDFHFTVEADTNANIPPLLWLPILENVFKHGTGVIADSYFIDYKFIVKDGTLRISSKNNYKEIVKNGDNKTGGIGLDNLRKRLALLYPGKHSLSFDKDDKYYTVAVEIEL